MVKNSGPISCDSRENENLLNSNDDLHTMPPTYTNKQFFLCGEFQHYYFIMLRNYENSN